MANYKVIILIAAFFILSAGCTTSQKINPEQTGKIEILEYNYETVKNYDKDFIVSIKNVGDTTISGTIDYTKYTCEKKPIVTKSGEFYNVKPGDTIKLTINLGTLEKDYYDISCYWTLNAGQKITTTGVGPRVIPET